MPEEAAQPILATRIETMTGANGPHLPRASKQSRPQLRDFLSGSELEAVGCAFAACLNSQRSVPIDKFSTAEFANVLNSTPLLDPGTRFDSVEQLRCSHSSGDNPLSDDAAKGWAAGCHGMQLMLGRFIDHTASGEEALQNLLKPQVEQTLLLAFASEAIARVTHSAFPRAAWLAGLLSGTGCLLSFARSKLADRVYGTTIRHLVLLLQDLQLHSSLSLPDPRQPGSGPWGVTSLASRVLAEASLIDPALRRVLAAVPPTDLPCGLHGVLARRLSCLQAECATAARALVKIELREPLGGFHISASPRAKFASQ